VLHDINNLPRRYIDLRGSKVGMSEQRLAEAGIRASVGSTGDSYDNALAEMDEVIGPGYAVDYSQVR
jgi:transposase InsO family protein